MFIQLQDESETVALGNRVGKSCRKHLANLNSPLVIFLNGELGAGKTTLSRGVLTAFGHTEAVKSPTYTLVEPYEFGNQSVFHFDLYRVNDEEELEFIGIRNYFSSNSLSLIEWSERAKNVLPEPDMIIDLTYNNSSRCATILNVSNRIQIAEEK